MVSQSAAEAAVTPASCQTLQIVSLSKRSICAQTTETLVESLAAIQAETRGATQHH
jgi:hypothetical protein